MASYILRRVILGLCLLLSVLWIVCFIIDLIPGTSEDYFNVENETTTSISLTSSAKVPLFYFGIFHPNNLDSSATAISMLPEFNWNGIPNQFHSSLMQILYWDFGNSHRDGLPVIAKIGDAVKWTLSIQIPHYILLLLIALYLGKYFATNENRISVLLSEFLLACHTIPQFWLASILIVLFASIWQIFPYSFIDISDQNAFQTWITRPYYYVLPLLSLIIPSISYVSRIYQVGLSDAMQSPYWIRAVSTGQRHDVLLNQEARPLALIPIAAWLLGCIPALIGGSLIIENIFSIPGVGRLLFQSITSRDWPVVKAILFFTSSLSIIAYLITDSLMLYLDPRLRKQSLWTND